MIREVMKRWWKELQSMGKREIKEFGSGFRCSRYTCIEKNIAAAVIDTPVEYSQLFSLCIDILLLLTLRNAIFTMEEIY